MINSDTDEHLAPHQWRAQDGTIVETADGSAWLKDPFEGGLLTRNKARDLAMNIAQQHSIKLAAAYEILAKLTGYQNWSVLIQVIENQAPVDAAFRQKKTSNKERAQYRKIVNFENQLSAGNELHDDVFGKNQTQPRGVDVTRTGYLVAHGAHPLNRQAVNAVYHAGPETRSRNEKRRI